MATTATALESAVKRAVRNELDKWMPNIYYVKATSDQAAGTPDLLICYRGVFIGMELKRPGEKPTALQQRRFMEITRAGGIGCVVTSAKEASDLLHVIDWYRTRPGIAPDTMQREIAIELKYVWSDE